MRVLVLGIRAPIAHDLIKSLLIAGHEVFGADCFIPKTITKLLPNENLAQYFGPALDYKAFSQDCKNIIHLFTPDLIIPMNEEVFYWAQFAKENKIPLFAPSLSQLMLLHSKKRFADYCLKIGLNFPKTEFYSKELDISNKVLKPEFSRFGENTLIKPKVPPKISSNENQYIVQDYIDGEDFSFYAIAINGKITAYSAYNSQWRANGGAALYFNPIFDAELFDAAKTLCASLGITGQISCDLRRDKYGKYWFLECNPRGTSGLHNIAFEKDFTKAFTDLRVLIQPTKRASKLGLAMLIYGLPISLLKFRFFDFIRDYFSARKIFENNRINLIIDTFRYFKAAIANKMSLASYLTHDIECNRDLDQK